MPTVNEVIQAMREKSVAKVREKLELVRLKHPELFKVIADFFLK